MTLEINLVSKLRMQKHIRRWKLRFIKMDLDYYTELLTRFETWSWTIWGPSDWCNSSYSMWCPASIFKFGTQIRSCRGKIWTKLNLQSNFKCNKMNVENEMERLKNQIWKIERNTLKMKRNCWKMECRIPYFCLNYTQLQLL